MRPITADILLVEDDLVDVMNIKRAFRKHEIGNELHVASNGIEALELLRDREKLPVLPRIVILDINMPKMNGIEFLQALRNDAALKHLTVFVLTTSNQERDRAEAYALNVAGYIVKPVDFEAFLTTVGVLKRFWQLIQFTT